MDNILMKRQIRVFQTHIEVYPYEEGDAESVEKDMSLYENYSYDPVGYYIENDTLYLPRGCSIGFLESVFKTKAILMRDPDPYDSFKWVEMTVPPRGRIQQDAIDFLCGDGKFQNVQPFSQQSLTLDTGDGKTYSAVYAIVKYRMCAVIITYLDKIRSQWKDTFLTKTNMDPSDVIMLNGSSDIDKVIRGKKVGNIYLVLHQTLNSYARAHNWSAVRDFFKATHAGIKIIDEAHWYYENTLRIDMFSNVKKTFYLTANFERGHRSENYLFKKCFSSVAIFGEETKSYVEKRKHIVYVPVLYHSNPTATQIIDTHNFYGFSALLFADYALRGDKSHTQMSVFYSVFEKACSLDGKILITTSKIDDTSYIKDCILEEYGETIVKGKDIRTIHSKHSREDNEEAAEKADIIISTIKSCGTGVDIPKLRCIINLEPFSSNVTSNQLSGRLREYAPDKFTYFFDLVDISFPDCDRQQKSKIKFLSKKCKEISIWRL